MRRCMTCHAISGTSGGGGGAQGCAPAESILTSTNPAHSTPQRTHARARTAHTHARARARKNEIPGNSGKPRLQRVTVTNG